MNDKAEKVYGEAFFELCAEEAPDKLEVFLGELTALEKIFDENPEFIKIMDTPTIPVQEKTDFAAEIAKQGNVSELCANLMGVLAERGRFSCFDGITRTFREMYNDRFKIAEITVTSSAPLSEKLRGEIKDRMAKATGRSITIKEKLDPSIIGGVIIDYGTTRYDGSVRARLNALKNELSGVIG